MTLGGGCPRRPVVHRKGRSGGGGDWGSGCLRQGNQECNWSKYKLLVLLSRRGREIRQACTRNTSAARWRPAEAREAVARARQDSEGGLERRATFRRRVGRAAAGDGAAVACTAATVRCSAPAVGSSKDAKGRQRRKKEGGVRGPVWKIQKFQGLRGKAKFPTSLKV
jgi:hypothetical protein